MNAKTLENIQRAEFLAASLVRGYRAAAPIGCDPVNFEGVVAATLAVSAVSAGVSAYSSASASSAEKDKLEYQANNAPQYSSYDPVLAKADPRAGVRTYLDISRGYGDELQNAAQQQNNFYQQSIEALAPSTLRNLTLADRNTSRELKGELPRDVSENIARAAAQASLTGGFGGSQMAGNLTARDFGLTSLQLRSQGNADLARNTALAQSLTPITAASLIGTPQQYQNQYDQYQQLNTGRKNDAAADAAGVQNRKAESNYFAGLAGVQGNAISPWANAAASGIGSLSSTYTSGMLGNRGATGSATAPVGTSSAGWNSGYYNPYMDRGNYDTTTGQFVGNANSFGWG